MVSLAGGWVLVLLIWRLFDKPEVSGATATVGIDWGIFVALVAAGTLVAAGAQMRAAGRPEPANPIAEEPEWEVPERRPRERPANGRPREHTEVTQVLRERPPSWEGEAPEPPGRAERPPRRAGRPRRTSAAARPPLLSNSSPAPAVSATYARTRRRSRPSGLHRGMSRRPATDRLAIRGRRGG